MRKLILLVLLLTFALTGRSQLEVGIFGGGSYYMGDLNPNIPFLQTSAAYGLLARYNISSRWAAKLNLYQGSLNGDDDRSGFLPERNLSFKNDITELGLNFEFHFLPYFNGSMKSYVTPYIFSGVALLYHNPQLDNKDLKDYGTEGQNNTSELTKLSGEDVTRDNYSNFVLSIPFGIGVKYSFSQRIAASLEWGMRKTFFDYLDDVSTTYYLEANLDPADSEYENQEYSDPNRNHDPWMQRGNSSTTDWYSFAGITLTYYIDLRNKNRCSDFEDN
ncbi:MAG: outer membrane beta-barrel protein [Bacteroidales bacterium]|nr:outer membrane beta-barrel protein [Bacteroidales bacterium]